MLLLIRQLFSRNRIPFNSSLIDSLAVLRLVRIHIAIISLSDSISRVRSRLCSIIFVAAIIVFSLIADCAASTHQIHITKMTPTRSSIKLKEHGLLWTFSYESTWHYSIKALQAAMSNLLITHQTCNMYLLMRVTVYRVSLNVVRSRSDNDG